MIKLPQVRNSLLIRAPFLILLISVLLAGAGAHQAISASLAQPIKITPNHRIAHKLPKPITPDAPTVPTPAAPPAPAPIAPLPQTVTAANVIAAVNRARVASGLPALAENAQLDASARSHGIELCQQNLWEHGNWADLLDQSGYLYVTAGENLGHGYTDIASLMDAWIASPLHYKNIVDPQFQEIGAYVLICPAFQGNVNEPLVVNQFGVQG